MQNVDSLQSVHTDEDILETDKGPKSLSSLADSSTSRAIAQEGIQSDPETRPKVKSRSRFSSAIRKLSKSARKKDQTTKDIPSAPTEAPGSSGGEDLPDSNQTASSEERPKKKSKLSKRFLLGSLKKSRTSSKKSIDETDEKALGPKEQVETYANLPHQASGEKGTRVAASGCQEREERLRKVQITISGKKIEQQRVLPSTAEPGDSPSESDYLTPIEDKPRVTNSRVDARTSSPSPASSPSKYTSTDASKAKKKKLKSKKASPALSKITITQTQTQTEAAETKTTSREERPVITQSARDTPPQERAPAKPSRAVVTSSSQTESSTGAIRKPITRAAATLTSPTITKLYERPSTSQQRQRSVNPTEIASSGPETELMQNTQRGHRFPQPSPTTDGTGEPASQISQPSVETAASVSTSTSNSTAISSQQPQIQFQSEAESQVSQSLALPSPAPEVPQRSTLRVASNDLLQPPSYTPPPVPSPVATPDTRSPVHRYPSPGTANEPELDLIQDTSANLVNTANSAGQDEVVSSAESAQPSEYSEKNYPSRSCAEFGISRNLESEIGKQPLQEGSSVNFAVGSPVRPQDISFDALRTQYSFDSNKSSASQSPASESNRKRIPFVAQPTLCDDFDSLSERRARYQAELSEFTLDSEFEPSEHPMPAFGNLTMEQEMEPAIVSSANVEKREHLYKILVIGELGTGKTSFIKRYVHQFFSQNYRATIGVDFALKVLHWDANTIVRLQLWDIAGQERFGNMTRVYYKEAVGAFIVFDVTRSGTFDCVSKWKEDLDSKVQLPDGTPIPCILLANKCDQEKQGVVTSVEKMDEYVRDNGFAGWFETSAKENINIDEAARALVNKILLNDKLISEADFADGEKFILNSSGDQTAAETKSKCSC